jgi:DNA-binding PadR family transcriptional regulator
MSEDALKVEHGSLYPALQRPLQEGWITAAWGISDKNQRANITGSPLRDGVS